MLALKIYHRLKVLEHSDMLTWVSTVTVSPIVSSLPWLESYSVEGMYSLCFVRVSSFMLTVVGICSIVFHVARYSYYIFITSAQKMFHYSHKTFMLPT
jgi:hypothetical protein